MTKIIGLSGFIGSGKGAVSDYLIDQHGFTKLNFSDALKDVVATVFNWPRDMLEGDNVLSREWREIVDPYWTARLNREITPRLVLQLVGTESFRYVIHPDIWVAVVEKKILDNNYKGVVISDVRFINELEMVKRNGGSVIRVERGKYPLWYSTALSDYKNRTDFMKVHYPEIHVSEYSLIGVDVDAVIKNDGTLDDLYNNVNKVIK